jgi:hypothetical protein
MNKEAVTGIKYARSLLTAKNCLCFYTELKMTAPIVLGMYTAFAYVARIMVLQASRAKRVPGQIQYCMHCVTDVDGLTRYECQL